MTGEVFSSQSFCALLLLIVPGQATIDKIGCARHIVRFGRSEKGRERSDIFGFAKAPERNFGKQGIQLRGIVQEVFVDGRFDGAGSDGIDGDAERGELDGEIGSELL